MVAAVGKFRLRRSMRLLHTVPLEDIPQTGGNLPIRFDQESAERFEVVGPLA